MRFNQKAVKPNLTVNLAGGEAYKESPELELVSTLLTSFIEDQYYRKAQDASKRILQLVDEVSDKKFTAKAAIFARTKYGMRSVSHLIAAALSRRVKGEQWMKNFINKVVYRPDDMAEILAAYFSMFGPTKKDGKTRPVPNAMKKGLAEAFNRFDAYQLAKYRGETRSVKLIDVVNLVRPKPTGKNAEALKQLVNDTLRSTETWEAKLTKAGQVAETETEKVTMKKDAWTDLLRNKKLGYFALLRNLRNIMDQAPEVLDEALDQLTDPDSIKKSLVLPFRFHTAYQEMGCEVNKSRRTRLSALDKVSSALSTAAGIALNNVPLLPGKTLVALDVSGSMEGKPFDIGSMFAVALARRNHADLIIFSDSAKYITLPGTEGVFESIDYIRKNSAWSGTNFHAIFKTAKHKYDRIIILSDMQAWMGYRTPKEPFAEYRKRTGASPVIYSFDLAGLGSLQFPEDRVYALAGWSEKIFDVMALLETDKKALINEINKVEI